MEPESHGGDEDDDISNDNHNIHGDQEIVHPTVNISEAFANKVKNPFPSGKCSYEVFTVLSDTLEHNVF